MGVSDNQERARHQLRHIAGLSAGEVTELRPGTHEFGLAPGDTGEDAEPVHVGFTIDVGDDGLRLTSSVASQHAHLLTLDGTAVSGSATLAVGQSIGLANDVFVVEDLSTRPILLPRSGRASAELVVPPLPDPPSSTPEWSLPTALVLLLAALLWVSFKDFARWPIVLPPAALVAAAWWLERRQARAVTGYKSLEADRVAQVRQDLRRLTAAEAARRRNQSIGVAHVLAATESQTWLPPHVQVAVAVGEAVWSPTLRERGSVDRAIERELDAGTRLHGVPLGLDVTDHLLAIVGPRAAALATARHLVSAVLSVQAAPRIEFRVSPAAAPDWEASWPQPNETSPTPYVIVDGNPTGARPPSGLIVSSSCKGLGFEPDAVMSIGTDGFATLRVSSSGLQTGRMAPIGISIDRFHHIVERHRPLDADPPGAAVATADATRTAAHPAEPRPAPRSSPGPENGVGGPVLVAAPTPDLALGQLTAMALNVCGRALVNGRTPLILVLDRADGGLRGLTTLDCPVHHLQVDDTAAIRRALAEFATAVSEGRPVAFFAHDFGASLHRLAAEGHRDLANRFVAVLRACSTGRGFAAVAEPPSSRLPTSLVRRFPVQVIHEAGDPWLIDANGRRALTRRSLLPRQVSEVVSALKSPRT